jgi:predicted nucleotidyltransferase
MRQKGFYDTGMIPYKATERDSTAGIPKRFLVYPNDSERSPVDHSMVQQLCEAFARHADIVCVYLYGSLAHGQSRRESDGDLTVLSATEPPSTLDGLGLELGNALERHLVGRPVDLLVLNRARVDLIHRVLRDGILIHNRNPAARLCFEAKAHNEYFGLLPYLRQYRRTTRSASL